MKKLSLGLSVGLAAFTLCTASSTFAAATGVITFNGELVSGTCDATVDATASADGTVTLPTTSIEQLAAADATAGITPFKIVLTGAGCTTTDSTSATITAVPYFVSEPGKVNTNGRLINTATTGAATNVDIQLLNNAQTAIDVNVTPVDQTVSTAVSAGADTNDFNYFARYYATDATTAGPVTASVTYNIMYK